jgi:hypothetical protein
MQPDVPVLLMSTQQTHEPAARAMGASFLVKNSPLLLNDLGHFMAHAFSFGDFVFRTPEGTEVGRATDLGSLEEQLRVVPPESIVYHAERNHFSNWLKARTEFWLAFRLRPRKVSDYPTPEALRRDLILSLHNYRVIRQRGIIADFSKEAFDPESSFARIGGGSLGGKARGLGFVSTLLNDYNVRDRFEEIQISVPPAVVVATDVFDRFLEENGLREFAIASDDDTETTRRFLEAPRFPEDVLGDLAAFLDLVRSPLAVRSSSLLEDSQYHPFAGVYQTYMIPNNHPNPLVRLNDLLLSIKRVYASTFYRSTKSYFRVTSYRLEEERMAVIVQKAVGLQHGQRFYPDISGVGKSYNFYPIPPQKASDGTVMAALGLGKYVVDGGNAVRFCPKYPGEAVPFASAEELLNGTQRIFYALQLDAGLDVSFEPRDVRLLEHPVAGAEADGTLTAVGSTYSPDDDRIHEGIARAGIRVVTFSPILRGKLFPLPQILELVLDMGTWGMGTPVEVEFAANLNVPAGRPREFALLQMRPLVIHREQEALAIDDADPARVVCRSSQVLGNGVMDDIRDVVLVDVHAYDRGRSREVAQEVRQFNARLIAEGRPFLLVGVGRWGSLDPWLGIPVTWEDIAGARAIVETGFREFAVTPSQGSHFFHNITSFMVGYFTVNDRTGTDRFDWDWFLGQPAQETRAFTRLIRLAAPLKITINGHQGRGIILRPEE